LHPYGFAWLRRTDDRNVDLNRNFLGPGEAYSGAPPGYAPLDPLLNPRRAPRRHEFFLLKALPALARSGMAAIRRAVAVGQYDFPHGLFFGGFGATPARRSIEAALAQAVRGCASVVHLDLHTGLGPSGQANVLIDYPLSDRQRARLIELFGPDGFKTPAGNPAAYTARGSLGQWCQTARLAPEYLFGFVEVGTFSGPRVLAALRQENRAHHWAGVDEAASKRAKERLREAFCPLDPAWRSRALAAALAVVDRVMAGSGRTGAGAGFSPHDRAR
jgi:hypothetical protein